VLSTETSLTEKIKKLVMLPSSVGGESCQVHQSIDLPMVKKPNEETMRHLASNKS